MCVTGGHIKPPLDQIDLPEGTYAVLTFKGPYAGLPQAYRYLYEEWLPRSSAQPADRPPFERYLNMPGQVPDEELLTEICVPLT
jgi:AraC family transcriptional regulator